mmetsp:Transcript_23011/g.66954  ORF Transcript_23011/g.66954 Transcript_23011/m.66954 type:complete len:340 (+) Transcript_23011:135-1154(+)
MRTCPCTCRPRPCSSNSSPSSRPSKPSSSEQRCDSTRQPWPRAWPQLARSSSTSARNCRPRLWRSSRLISTGNKWPSNSKRHSSNNNKWHSSTRWPSTTNKLCSSNTWSSNRSRPKRRLRCCWGRSNQGCCTRGWARPRQWPLALGCPPPIQRWAWLAGLEVQVWCPRAPAFLARWRRGLPRRRSEGPVRSRAPRLVAAAGPKRRTKNCGRQWPQWGHRTGSSSRRTTSTTSARTCSASTAGKKSCSQDWSKARGRRKKTRSSSTALRQASPSGPRLPSASPGGLGSSAASGGSTTWTRPSRRAAGRRRRTPSLSRHSPSGATAGQRSPSSSLDAARTP